MTEKQTELHVVVLKLAESGQLAKLTKIIMDTEAYIAKLEKVAEAAREYWGFCVSCGWETSKDHYLDKSLKELDGYEDKVNQ